MKTFSKRVQILQQKPMQFAACAAAPPHQIEGTPLVNSVPQTGHRNDDASKVYFASSGDLDSAVRTIGEPQFHSLLGLPDETSDIVLRRLQEFSNPLQSSRDVSRYLEECHRVVRAIKQRAEYQELHPTLKKLISDDDIVILVAYTMAEWPPNPKDQATTGGGCCLYKTLNANLALREWGEGEKNAVGPCVKRLKQVLRKLCLTPEPMAYRGLRVEASSFLGSLYERFTKKESIVHTEIRLGGFTSFSRDEQRALGFLFGSRSSPSEPSYGILYRCPNLKGYDISPFSCYKHERETLVDTPSIFRVDDAHLERYSDESILVLTVTQIYESNDDEYGSQKITTRRETLNFASISAEDLYRLAVSMHTSDHFVMAVPGQQPEQQECCSKVDLLALALEKDPGKAEAYLHLGEAVMKRHKGHADRASCFHYLSRRRGFNDLGLIRVEDCFHKAISLAQQQRKAQVNSREEESDGIVLHARLHLARCCEDPTRKTQLYEDMFGSKDLGNVTFPGLSPEDHLDALKDYRMLILRGAGQDADLNTIAELTRRIHQVSQRIPKHYSGNYDDSLWGDPDDSMHAGAVSPSLRQELWKDSLRQIVPPYDTPSNKAHFLKIVAFLRESESVAVDGYASTLSFHDLHDRLAQWFPRDLDVAIQVTKSLLKRELYEEAIHLLKSHLDPNGPSETNADDDDARRGHLQVAWHLLGLAHKGALSSKSATTVDVSEVQECYKRSIALDPTRGHPYRDLARTLKRDEHVYLLDGTRKRKLDLFCKALRCNPTDASAYNELAICLHPTETIDVFRGSHAPMNKRDLYLCAIHYNRRKHFAYCNLAEILAPGDTVKLLHDRETEYGPVDLLELSRDIHENYYVNCMLSSTYTDPERRYAAACKAREMLFKEEMTPTTSAQWYVYYLIGLALVEQPHNERRATTVASEARDAFQKASSIRHNDAPAARSSGSVPEELLYDHDVNIMTREQKRARCDELLAKLRDDRFVTVAASSDTQTPDMLEKHVLSCKARAASWCVKLGNTLDAETSVVQGPFPCLERWIPAPHLWNRVNVVGFTRRDLYGMALRLAPTLDEAYINLASTIIPGTRYNCPWMAQVSAPLAPCVDRRMLFGRFIHAGPVQTGLF